MASPEGVVEMQEWTTAQLKELIDVQLALRDKALELQAAEYQRRLEVLNHANERADEALRTYVPRERFEAKVGQLEDAHDANERAIGAVREQYVVRTFYDGAHGALERRLATIERWQSNVMGRAVAIAVIGSIFVATVVATASHLFNP